MSWRVACNRIVPLALLVGGIALPSSVLAQGSQSTTVAIHVPGFAVVACNGETVEFSNGMDVSVERTNFDGSGGSHFKVQKKIQGSNGVGLASGYKYRFYSVNNDELENTNPPGAISFTSTSSTTLTGQGSANNTLMSTTIHFTFNNLGAMTANVERFNVECPSDSGMGLSFP
jgi:hypothetical protein